MTHVLESLRGCLRVVLPKYTVGWDKEKKSQKKIVFFLLIDFFQQHLISTYYVPGIMLSAGDIITYKAQVPTLQRNALVFFKWAGVGT